MSAVPGQARAVFTSFAESPRFEADGVTVATLLGSDDSGGRSEVREIRCMPGKAVASLGTDAGHRYIQVVAGDWEIVVGDDRRACAADTTIVAPRGMACGGSVTGEGEGRLLVLTFPG